VLGVVEYLTDVARRPSANPVAALAEDRIRRRVSVELTVEAVGDGFVADPVQGPP
jgi:hypothetical protein